jgi:hypothetical protein
VLRLLSNGQPQDQACGQPVSSFQTANMFFELSREVEVSVTMEWTASPGANGYRVFLGPPTDRRELTTAPTDQTNFKHVTTMPLYQYPQYPAYGEMTYWVLAVYPERTQYWSEPGQVVLTSDLKFCE